MKSQHAEEKVRNLEQKLVRLKEQNQKLSEQACNHRNVVISLEDTIARHEDRWRDFQSTLLCVNRCWELLHHDILLLKSRATGSEREEVEDDDWKAHEDEVETNAWEDPFIAALIGPWEDSKGESEVMGHMSKGDRLLTDVERSLSRRAEKTKTMMASLLDDIRAMEKSDAGLRADQVDEEVAELETALEKESACSRALLERVRIAEDQLFQKTHELQATRNELADKQGQVERAERKLLSLRQQSSKVQEPSEHKLPPGFGGVIVGEPRAPVGPSVHVKKEEDADGEMSGAAVDGDAEGKWKQILDAKNEEWAAEREGYIKIEKELASLRDELSSENFVLGTARYQAVVDQRAQVLLEVKKKESEIQAIQQQLVQKDRELQRKKSLDPEGRCRDFQALQDAQKRIAELHQQVLYAEQARHNTELELQSEREKRGDAQTVKELKCMVKTLQNELTMKERSLRDRVVNEEKIRTAREESQELGRSWKEAQVKVDRIHKELKENEQKLISVEKSRKQHKATVGDLEVFVEVLTTFCQDRRSEAEVRSSEEKLKREIADMKEQVSGVRIEDYQEELSKLTAKVQEAENEGNNFQLEVDRLQRENRHLQEDLNQQKSLKSGLEQEVEATGTAYEEMQSQNTRLLQQATEKDDANEQLRSQITQLSQQIGRLKMEIENKKEAYRLNARAGEEVELIRKDCEGRVEELKTVLKESQDKVGSLTRGLEGVKEEKQKKDIEVEGLLEQVENFKKMAKDRKRLADERLEKCIREDRKRQKLEKELEGLHGHRSGDLSIDDRKEMEILEIEVEELRKTLNCSVCESNRKSVILTKCWHTFCRQCITNRLETRNRKCPGCGTQFGQTDVKSLFLT